jgi:hypothetical protein
LAGDLKAQVITARRVDPIACILQRITKQVGDGLALRRPRRGANKNGGTFGDLAFGGGIQSARHFIRRRLGSRLGQNGKIRAGHG